MSLSVHSFSSFSVWNSPVHMQALGNTWRADSIIFVIWKCSLSKLITRLETIDHKDDIFSVQVLTMTAGCMHKGLDRKPHYKAKTVMKISHSCYGMTASPKQCSGAPAPTPKATLMFESVDHEKAQVIPGESRRKLVLGWWLFACWCGRTSVFESPVQWRWTF